MALVLHTGNIHQLDGDPDAIFSQMHQILLETISLSQVLIKSKESNGFDENKVQENFKRIFEFKIEELVQERKLNILKEVIHKLKSFTLLTNEQSTRIVQLESLYAFINNYRSTRCKIDNIDGFLTKQEDLKNLVLKNWKHYKEVEKVEQSIRDDVELYRSSFNDIKAQLIVLQGQLEEMDASPQFESMPNGFILGEIGKLESQRDKMFSLLKNSIQQLNELVYKKSGIRLNAQELNYDLQKYKKLVELKRTEKASTLNEFQSMERLWENIGS